MGAGSVCHLAAQKLIETRAGAAALELAVEPSQVEYAKGVFQLEGIEAHGQARQTSRKRSRSASIAEGKFGSTYPNGCHIAEVEIDPDTGADGDRLILPRWTTSAR